MQKFVIATIAVLLFSCRAEEKKETESKEANKEGKTDLPYEVTYSSKFEIGDSKYAESLLALWKAWDDGDILAKREFFADSMRFYTRDGSVMEGKTDSVMKGAQAFRSMFSSMKSTVHAYMPLKSTDKNDNWVCIWGTEVSTDKQGKTDSVALQETWRFNKDGKIDLMYQFGRSLMPSATPK